MTMELLGYELHPIVWMLIVWHAFLVGIVLIATMMRKSASPEKSYKHALLSVILTPFRALGVGPYKHGALTVEGAVKYALKKTKLSDWGPDNDWMDNYKQIMDSPAHRQLRFSNLGYISASKELNLTFVRRLKFFQYLKDCPEILKLPVRAPTFVMGLPRTGTTFLHRLLALDPSVRSPMTWELLNPVPATTDRTAFRSDRLKRRGHIKKILDMRQGLGDNALAHIHEVGLDLPEECLLALSDELPILTQHLYSDYMNTDVFLNLDATKAYKHYHKYLQLLQYQVEEPEASKRWMLKCPIHLFYTKQIAKAFPDAKLIWTHRDPNNAVPSMASLVKAFHQVYFEQGRDDVQLGRKIMRVSAELLTRAPQDIIESKLDCGHVAYKDLIKDPKAVVQKLYNSFGWEYTQKYDAVLDAFLRTDAEKRAKVKKETQGSSAKLHSYAPEDYGLTSKELGEGKFKLYSDKFL